MIKIGKILDWFWTIVASHNSVIRLVAEVFDCVQVWAMGRLVLSINPIWTHDSPRHTTVGVAILEVTCVQPVKLPQYRRYIVIQNSVGDVGVELTMNCDQWNQTKPGIHFQTIISPFPILMATMHLVRSILQMDVRLRPYHSNGRGWTLIHLFRDNIFSAVRFTIDMICTT